ISAHTPNTTVWPDTCLATTCGATHRRRRGRVMRAFAFGLVAVVGCGSGSIDGAGQEVGGAGVTQGAGAAGPTASVAATSGAGASGGTPGAGAAGGGGPGGGGPGGGSVEGPLPPGNWTPIWVEDFDGASLDATRWATQSDSYSDQCRGNHPDHKLEYNLP